MENKITSVDFNLSIKNGSPVIARNLVLYNGDTISFSATLQKDDNATIRDLHRRSVEQVIATLQNWIKP